MNLFIAISNAMEHLELSYFALKFPFWGEFKLLSGKNTLYLNY